VNFDNLQRIIDIYDTAQNFELSDDTKHFGVRETFENQYYEFKANFSELIYPVFNTPRSEADQNEVVVQVTAITFRGHIGVANKSSYQTLYCQISKVTRVAGYMSETHLRNRLLIIQTCLMSSISTTSLLQTRTKPNF